MKIDKSPKISLVISDVDGTLIDRQKELTPRTIAAVKQLQQANIPFTVTSARPPYGLNMIIDTLQLQHPIGAFNGGAILTPNLEIINRTALPADIIPEVIAAIESYNLDIWLLSDRHWYVKDLNGYHVAHHSDTLQFEPTSIASNDDIKDEIVKIVGVSSDYDAVARGEKAMQKQFGNRLSASRSQAYYLDITHPNANKGTAVDRLAEYFKIPVTEIITIGDNCNDVYMFARSGISVAMGNAIPEVQQKATYVTASNENEGFAKAIEQYVLSNLSYSY